MLFINILPLQQTTPTMFITTLIVVVLFIVVLFYFSKNNENEEIIDLDIKMNQLTKEIKSYQDEIQEVCSFVEKHYDKSKNIISIKPKDYGFYPELGDPIEETEVMVIEYLQVLKEKERIYKYEWSYLGLINELCVYKIDKKLKYNKNESFSLDDISSALLSNNTLQEDVFIDNKLKISVIPLLIPIDNLGFNRDLSVNETANYVKYFCKDTEFDFISDRLDIMEKKGVKYHKYYLIYKDDIKNVTNKKSRRVSQSTKDKVWRRDEGKCVECDSNEKLEFDHIIPFSKGGSNTYRNIQLLCESCNRSKSDKIG